MTSIQAVEKLNNFLTKIKKYMPIGNPFVAILTYATSRSQIEYLLNLLPENCQLPNAMKIELQDIWSGLSDNKSNLGNNWDENILSSILKQTCCGHHFGGMYYEMIKDRAEKSTGSYEGDGELVHSSVEREGYGGVDFLVDIFNTTFNLGLMFYKNKNEVRIRLVKYSDFLTEKVTHQIIKNLPQYKFASQMWGRGGHDTGIVYYFPVNTTPIEVPRERIPYPSIVATPEFLQEVENKMKEIGIPLEGSIVSVLTEETPMS